MGIMGQHQLFLKATLFLVLGCSWCHLAEAKDPFFQPRRNSRQLINDPSFIPLGDQVPLEPVEHRGLPEPPLLDDDPFGYLLQTTTEAMTDDTFEPASPPPPYVEPIPSVTEQYPYEQEPENNQIRPFDEEPWWDSQPFPRRNVASGRSLFDNVPKTSQDSYASSFFPDRIFGSPPTPKDLGFPSIENTEDNWLFDVDWSSFGRRKRRSPVPVTTGSRSTASRTGTKPTAAVPRQTREGSSAPKEEYDGPYIYTQLFGPPYEVGYIRSPVPSKHVYQDYLQFVRSWSAASRDAVDEQLQANPASIDTYKSVKASSGAGSYDNNDQNYKETVQKDAYKETSGVESHGETLFRKEPTTYDGGAYAPASSNSKSPAPALNYHSPPIGYVAPETEFRPTNKAYHTAAAGAKSPVYVESGFTPLKNNKQPSYDSPTTYRPGTVTNGDAYASPVAPIKYDSVKPTSNKPAAYQTSNENQNYKPPSSQQDYQSGDSLPVSYDILKPFNNYDKKNDNSYEPVTKYKTPESGLYQEPPKAYKEEEKKNAAYEDDLYPAAAPVYEEESYKSPPSYQEEPYKSPAYKEEPKTVAVLYKEEPVYKAPVISYKEEPYNSAPAAYKEESYREEPYNKEKTPVYEDESYKEPTYKPTPAYKEPVVYKEESYIKVPLNKEVPIYKEDASYKNTAPVYKEESYEKPPAYKEEPYKPSAPAYKEESYEKAPIYKEEPYKPARPAYKDEPYEKVLPYREDPYEKPSDYKEEPYKPEPSYKEEPYKPAPSYKEEPYEKAPVYKAEEAYKPSTGPTYKEESYGNTAPAYKDQPYENKAPAVYKDESYEKTPAYKEPSYESKPPAYKDESYEKTPAYKEQSYESKPPAYKEESNKPASQYKEESYQAAPAYKEDPYKEAPKNVYQDAPSRSPYPGSLPTRYVEPPPYETASAVIKNPYKSNSYDQNLPPTSSVQTYPKYDEPSAPSYDKNPPGNYGGNTPYVAPVAPSRQVEPPLYSTPGKSSAAYQQSSKDQTNYASDNKKYPSEGYKEDVDPSSTSYQTNYETSKDSSYAHDGYSPVPKKESSPSYSQESKPSKSAASYSTNVNQSGSTKKHYPVIIGRYQVTDSTAFLPKKVDGGSTSTNSKTSSGKPVAAGSHVHGANGEEYVVYYLPYGQPLPIPIRKKRGTNPIVYLRSLADRSRPSRGQSEEIMDVLLPEQVHKNVLANQAAESVNVTPQEPAEHRDQQSGIIDGSSVVPDAIQEEEDEALEVPPETSPELIISDPSVSQEGISPVIEVLEDEKVRVPTNEETSNPSDQEDGSLLEETNEKEEPLSVDEVISNPEEESSDGSSAERGISFADFVAIKTEKEENLESFVKPAPLEEIAFNYPHKNQQESSKSADENKKVEEGETSTLGVLPGLTQRPVEYLKPPGLAEEVEDHWNGYSAWWTKLGNRIAKIYRYE